MIAEPWLEAFRDFLGRLARQDPARARGERPQAHGPCRSTSCPGTTPRCTRSRIDPTVTYLQVLYPPPAHVELVEKMYRHFGDEVMIHLEFVRFEGQIACFGLPIVRFTSEERLDEIIAYHEDHGCPIFNPHAFTLEEGGMKQVDRSHLAFKREADPQGLLNPGKMLGWDNPDFAGMSRRSYLYRSLEG